MFRLILKNRLTQEKLKQIILYDPLTGNFTWKVTTGRRSKAGQKAGSLHSQGYIVITIYSKQHKAHRLAWFYMTGKWPKSLIDHKDLNRSNNTWKNIRNANKSQNAINSYGRNDNKSGYKGVFFHKKQKVYHAAITINGKRKHLGCYKNAEEAYLVYCNYAKALHGKFARLEKVAA